MARKFKKDEVLAMTVTQLVERGLAVTTANAVTYEVHRKEWNTPTWRPMPTKDRRALWSKTSVLQIIDIWQGPFDFSAHHRDTCPASLSDVLVDLGLTVRDWMLLPSSTCDKIRKHELLDLPAICLGTLTGPASSGLTKFFCQDRSSRLDRDREHPHDITIRKLLTLEDGWETSTEQWFNYKGSMEKTRTRLRELKFTEKDGPLMRITTPRQRLVEQIAREENLTKAMAEKLVALALKRHWLSYSIK